MAKFTCNFISYTLNRAIDISVVVPSVTMPEIFPGDGNPLTHDKEGKYPVIYLYHGLGNNHATWCGYANVELFAEERNIAVVMISGENKMYINEGMDRFYDFIEKELPEFVTRYFPISKKPEDTYIAGLSMGGCGTFIHGLNHPERYAALGVFSCGMFLPPDLKTGKKRETEDRFDPEKLVEKLHEQEITKQIFLACGEEDHLYEDCVKTRDKLVEYGHDVTWVSIPGYKHEWRFWNMMIEQFMDWLPRTDKFLPKGGKRGI